MPDGLVILCATPFRRNNPSYQHGDSSSLPPTAMHTNTHPPRLTVRTDSSDSDVPMYRPHSVSGTSVAKSMEEKQEALWQELNDFYTQNQAIIERASQNMSIDNMSDMDVAVETFVETANTLLPGLVGLANIHPGLGVVVFAFAGVISLDMARRGNNRKVLAVNLQMQNMMCAMFQLRKLRHIHIDEPEREEEQTRLHRLIKTIAKEIKVCGSDINYYMERKFVSKLINAKTYEHRFAFHIETFASRRSELQSMITAYIATGVDAANIGIVEIQDQLFNMEDKINTILQAFRNMDTPREREIQNFIESNGGADMCISKDDLLVKLLLKSGDNATSGKQIILKGQDLMEIRQSLRTEFDESLDAAMAANLPRFERLLNVQNNNFERLLDKIENQGYEISDHTTKLDKLVTTTISILEEERHIRKATAPVMSISFTDPVLQFIWNRMGLKGSVKAKTFVLTFRDIFQVEAAELSREFMTPIVPHHTIYTPFLEVSPTRVLSLLNSETNDHWALKYINVSHVQPVVEAIDEDGSGFISVKEANTFAISRPKGWSFLRWVAYWAAGWHIDVSNYRTRIYSIVQQIHHLTLSVHPANRAFVDEYLGNRSFNVLEALLRPITPLPEKSRIDSRLTEIVESMSSLMETRLAKNLEEMNFILESPATVNLVVGSGRVETWLLPLLFLLLDRHLQMITSGERCVFHEKEMALHIKTLESIFSLVHDRVNHLESIFRTHVNQDIKAQFDKFAFGMFSVIYTEKEDTLSRNTLLTFKDDKISLNHTSSRLRHTYIISPSVLTMGLGPVFEFDEINFQPRNYTKHPMEGLWTGQCIRTNNSQIAFQGFFRFSIDRIVDGKLYGRGETYLGEVNFSGIVEPDPESNVGVLNVELRIDSEKYADLWCLGQYDPERDSIGGQWVVDDDSGDFPPPDDETKERQLDLRLPCGHFFITRTPASVFRFRHSILNDYEGSTFKNLARRRWAFAIQAVCFQVRERFLSWQFIQKHTAERRTWMELTIRRELDKASPASKPQLSEQGKETLFALRLTAHPTVGRMYDALANYFYKRMAFNIGPYNCHCCDRRIIFSRYQCIICTSNDFTSQLDLCKDCIDVPFPLPGSAFEHHVSHTLLRSTRRVFDFEIASIIIQARSSSERIKSSFRLIESLQKRNTASPGSEIRNRQAMPSEPLLCGCCGDSLSLPCWVCVTCSLTYICLSCNEKRSPLRPRTGISNIHSFDHPLLRINDSLEVIPAELKATRLEKQLQDMEIKLNSTILSLSQKIDARLPDRGDNAVYGNPSLLLSPPLADRDADFVPAATMEAKIARSRTTAGFAAKRKRIEEGALAARLEERMLALETKVDRQFGQLLSMMQQLVASNTPRSSTM